jgi:hypothetical protein
MLVVKSEGKERVSRSSSRRMDNIKISHNEIGFEGLDWFLSGLS